MNTHYKVHGSIIASRLNYIADCWDLDSKQLIINHLPIKEKLMIRNSFFENTWFDFSTLTLIDQIITDKFANGNYEILHQLGRYSAEYSFHRLPIQLLNQQLKELFTNFSRINAMFYNFGQIHLANFTNNSQFGHVSLHYSYPLNIPNTFCLSMLGYFERLLEMLGYFVIKVSETSCEPEIGLHSYEIYWQAITLEELFIPVKALPVTKNQPTFSVTQQITRTNSRKTTSNNFQKLPVKSWKLAQVILPALVILLGCFCFTQASKPTNSSIIDHNKIISYKSLNNNELTLSLDSPYLIIKSTKSLSKVVITAYVDNKSYSYKASHLASDRVLEVSLGEFACSNGQAFNLEKLPNKFIISANLGNNFKEYNFYSINI